MLLVIIGVTFLISLLSLLGAVLFSNNEKLLNKLVFYLVGLSTGTLLGGAFFHLIPESLESLSFDVVSVLMLVSFSVFFMLEKILHWHHCHDGNCDTHSLGYMNLIGDCVHNFIDGVIIASAFSLHINLGIISAIAIIFHEIPQELGDFGVLIYSGMKKNLALTYNFISSLSSILGGVLGYMFLSTHENLFSYVLPIAAGGFLYISTSDLLPEIRKEPNLSKSIRAYMLFVVGLVLMYVLKFAE